MKASVLHRQFSNALGEEAELEVTHALPWMRGQGEIQDFYQTQRCSLEDAQGIDFVLFVTNRWIPIAIQVKRSAGKSLLEHRRKYPHIPVVVVSLGDVMAQLRKIVDVCLNERAKRRSHFRNKLYSQSAG